MFHFSLPQVLDEVCICGIVFNDRNSTETTITHLLINWPSSTEEFYTHRTSRSETAGKHAFSVRLPQDGSPAVAGAADRKEQDAGQARLIAGCTGHTAARDCPDESSAGGPPLTPPECDSSESPAAQDSEGHVTQFGALWNAPPPFKVSWGSVSCQSHIDPAHNGRGAYVYRLSPSGDVSALAVNERNAKNIRVFFFSPLTPGELSSPVYPMSREESKQTGR